MTKQQQRAVVSPKVSPWLAGNQATRRFLHVEKGRGAVSNVTGRFEPLRRSVFFDGWDEQEAPEKLRTDVTDEFPKTIISRNQSPDVPFDQSINPYRGCEHGCVYCFARPTHAYMGLSPGLDFESRLFAKPDAASILERQISNRNYQVKPIALGTNTDPYQPIERERRITRSVLQVLAAHDHPLTILTKSRLVVRDLDILSPMAQKGLVKVALSVTTLDRKLARTLEPRAAMPQRRLDAIKLLSDAGIPTGVVFAPVIPALNDHEMEQVLAAAAHAGAHEAGYIPLRLPSEVASLFEEWLETYFPDRKSRVLSRLKGLRGGRLNDPRFKHRMKGSGFEADLMKQRFVNLCRRLKLNQQQVQLKTDLFRPPEGDQLGFDFGVSAA